jgi:monovalent cation:H+ antiporter-2, CPA2 family
MVVHSTLEGILVLLAAAVCVSAVFRTLKLSSVLGYLCVGALVGPYGLGWLQDKEATRHLAEFGVVFLMFTIGLEFSLPELIAMRRSVFGLGALQVLITTLFCVGMGSLSHIPVGAALVMGGILAMSSTAIVMKQLTEQLEMDTAHGRNSLGILLFQDLAVIPFLIMIPSLSGNTAILVPLMHALTKASIAMTAIVIVGRKILRPIFYHIADIRSVELFTLTVLLVTLGSSWLTDYMGLSYALGAFIAGMMLGETEFRHQIESEIRPFRDVLLGLFFITIGMLFNTHVFLNIWLGVLLLFFLMVFLKIIIISLLCRFMGTRGMPALRTGFILAQGGEFSFALLSLAIDHHVFDAYYGQMLLGALLCSMAIAPTIIRYNAVIVQWLLGKKSQSDEPSSDVTTASSTLSNHVVICGYGRMGQHIAHLLASLQFLYVAIDRDPKRVKHAQLAGDHVVYGSMVNLDILTLAGIHHARALVICITDVKKILIILQQVRQINHNIPIIIRNKDTKDKQMLLDAGANHVISEREEATLAIAFNTLLALDITPEKAIQTIHQERHVTTQSFKNVYQQTSFENTFNIPSTPEQLLVMRLTDGAWGIGKTIDFAILKIIGVTLNAVRRHDERITILDVTFTLQAHDVVILEGPMRALERAERYFLSGE